MSDDRSALRAVLRGGSISHDRGDASFIGGALRELARTLREAAETYRRGNEFLSYALLRHFAFGQSVTLELEISPEENVQLGVEGGRHSPTIDAARAIAALLASDDEEIVPRAAELGPEAASSYKRFLNLIGSDDVKLEWQVAEATEVVVVTSVDARRDFAILDMAGDQVTEVVQVPGRLTMADSELRQFALTLPPELARPPLLKGKHRVRGVYSEEMGDKLKGKGLWDSDVMATVEVAHDLYGTTATPRDPTYTLVDAEQLVRPQASLFDEPEREESAATPQSPPPPRFPKERVRLDKETEGRSSDYEERERRVERIEDQE